METWIQLVQNNESSAGGEKMFIPLIYVLVGCGLDIPDSWHASQGRTLSAARHIPNRQVTGLRQPCMSARLEMVRTNGRLVLLGRIIELED
jgi:hypothetical protein